MADASGSAPLKIVVETEDGLFMRVVEGATPLAAGPAQGRSAEDATQSSAAKWGLPDFVFQAGLDQKGSGNRELGDVLLIVGNRAAVVQVKSRANSSGETSREQAWTHKAIAKAVRQAAGVVRGLRQSPATLTNTRGREHLIDGATLQWLGVVIIDHAFPPTNLLPTLPTPRALPMVVLLRRDWEFLFDQLRSADAVMSYLSRVCKDDPVPLGDEPLRYYDLATLDEEAPLAPPPAAMHTLGGRPFSVPALPKVPAGRDDMRAHSLLRMILEDIATVPFLSYDEAIRMTILAEIDSLAVASRTELGQLLDWMLEHVGQVTGDQRRWAARRYFRDQEVPHLLFAASSFYDDLTSLAFKSLVQFRHYELGQACGTFDGLTTVGVLLTPRQDGRRPWDTSVTRVWGDVDYEPGSAEVMRRLWGASNDHAAGEVWEPDLEHLE